MIYTLRNNKNLLKRRNSAFQSPRTYGEIRKLYANRVRQATTKISDKQRQEIRQRIREEQNKKLRLKLYIFGTVVVLFGGGMVYLFKFVVFDSSSSLREKQEIRINKKAQKHREVVISYEDNMRDGEAGLNKNEPFLAIGYFEKALEAKPGDELAIRSLIVAYKRLCEQREKTCETVEKNIIVLENQLKQNKP